MKEWKSLLTREALEQLQANHREQLPVKGSPQEVDFKPAAKLFNPTGGGTWLISEVDDDGIAFGLADLGFPELGYISMEELAEFQGRAGLGIEQDRHWTAKMTLSEYAKEARKLGYIKA